MGRPHRLMPAVLGVAVLVTTLVASTTTVDTADGRPDATTSGSTVLGAPPPEAAATAGHAGSTCSHTAGCRTRAVRATTASAGRGSKGSASASGAPTAPTADGAPTTADANASAPSGSSTATTAPAAGAGPSRSITSTWWRPPAVVAWQWELDHPLNLASASDMGTGVTTYLGAPAPDPTVYDIDGFDNTAATVGALHARGDHAVCYIEVGAAESYRPDYSEFPASDLGTTVPDYPTERYLDINDAAVVRVIEARIAMCASKGFDAVEPDIDDSYTGSTGFAISMAQNVTFDSTLSAYAHGLGLGWALKNGDDPSFAASMEPAADFALDEQCHQYATCGSFAPFASAGKAVLEVEYTETTSQFCPAANAANQDAMAMDVSLSGGRQPCR